MSCAACDELRLHTPIEWVNHPLAGHGYSREGGWSHPDAKAAHDLDVQLAAEKLKKLNGSESSKS